MAAPSSPPARPIATLLSIEWERGDRWIVRRRADHLVMRAVVVGVCVGAMVPLFVVGQPFATIGVPIFVFIGIVAVLLGRRRAANAEFLWNAAELLVDGRSIPFAAIQSVIVGTELQVRRGKYSTTATQTWSVSVRRSGEANPVELARHANEYAILRAGRRMAFALGVPCHDLCGGERAAPRTAVEATTADGIRLSFHVRRTAAVWFALLSAAGTVGVFTFVPFDRGPEAWTPALSLLVLLPLLFGSAYPALSHGRHTIVVEKDRVRIRQPMRPSRVFRREQIREVRLATRLLPSPTPPPRPGVINVDLLDAQAHSLARLPLTPEEAPAAADSLSRALGLA